MDGFVESHRASGKTGEENFAFPVRASPEAGALSGRFEWRAGVKQVPAADIAPLPSG